MQGHTYIDFPFLLRLATLNESVSEATSSIVGFWLLPGWRRKD